MNNTYSFVKIAMLVLGLMGGTATIKAQQDAQYTNFMFNKMQLNPAFAGAMGYTTAQTLYRDQWHGLDGAPKTISATINAPLMNDKIGLGAALEADFIGFTKTFGANFSYAYRVPVANGKLALGVQGGIRNIRIDWDQAKPTHIGDGAIPSANTSVYNFNAGAGLYYYSNKVYVGVSMPRFFNSQYLSPSMTGQTQSASGEWRHLLAMAGVVIPLSEKVKFTPNILMKYVSDAPIDFDINASFLFFDKLTIGATYRKDDSVDAIIHWLVTPQLRLGLGYDFTLTDLRTTKNMGSYEVLLGYNFIPKEAKMLNPRFFF